MATVSVILGYRAADHVPLMRTEVRASEVVTSSAASAQSTIVAQDNEFWEVSCASALWIKFGTNPTASAGDVWYVPAGTPRNFQAKVGDKIAVIDA